MAKKIKKKLLEFARLFLADEIASDKKPALIVSGKVYKRAEQFDDIDTVNYLSANYEKEKPKNE